MYFQRTTMHLLLDLGCFFYFKNSEIDFRKTLIGAYRVLVSPTGSEISAKIDIVITFLLVNIFLNAQNLFYGIRYICQNVLINSKLWDVKCNCFI